MLQNQRQNEENINNRQNKCFSNRVCYHHIEPYSHDFLKAKRKAFERYKKIYPIQEKENLYQMAKTPYLGYYVMKGYKPKLGEQGESKDVQPSHAKSSDKIINHLLKRYLHRKEQSNAYSQYEILPRVQRSVQLHEGHLTSMTLKKAKKNARLFTQYQGKQNARLRKRAPIDSQTNIRI